MFGGTWLMLVPDQHQTLLQHSAKLLNITTHKCPVSACHSDLLAGQGWQFDLLIDECHRVDSLTYWLTTVLWFICGISSSSRPTFGLLLSSTPARPVSTTPSWQQTTVSTISCPASLHYTILTTDHSLYHLLPGQSPLHHPDNRPQSLPSPTRPVSTTLSWQQTTVSTISYPASLHYTILTTDHSLYHLLPGQSPLHHPDNRPQSLPSPGRLVSTTPSWQQTIVSTISYPASLHYTILTTDHSLYHLLPGQSPLHHPDNRPQSLPSPGRPVSTTPSWQQTTVSTISWPAGLHYTILTTDHSLYHLLPSPSGLRCCTGEDIPSLWQQSSRCSRCRPASFCSVTFAVTFPVPPPPSSPPPSDSRRPPSCRQRWPRRHSVGCLIRGQGQTPTSQRHIQPGSAHQIPSIRLLCFKIC